MRTLIDITAVKYVKTSSELITDYKNNFYGEFEEHNALEDAKFQAAIVSYCYKKLI